MKSAPTECKHSTTESIDTRLSRGLAGTAGLRMAGLALAFVTNILLGRVLGVKEYGVLVYVMAWVGLLSVVGIFGLNRLLVREVANYRMQAAWGLLRGLLRWTHVTALLISLGIAALAICICPRPTTQLGAQIPSILPIAGCLLICIVMVRMLGSALLGLQRIVSSQIAEMLIQPALGFILIITLALLWHGRLAASQVITLYMVAAGTACIFSGWQLKRALPPELTTTPLPVQYASKYWLVAALPLFLVSILDVLNGQISSLMLGTFSGTSALGMYAAADRGAQLVAFPLAVVNLTLAPTFANLYQAEQYASLQRLVTKGARLILIASAPIALTLILGGHWFLFLFGHGFSGGQAPLTILCIGQLVNAVMGPVGFLLIMTGHGREAAIGIAVGVAVNSVLSAILIPQWGASGAAAATASSLIIWNIMLALFVWKRIGIKTTAFGYTDIK